MFATYAPSEFIDRYDLWSWVILFCLLGVYHFLTVAIWHWFRLLGEINEAYFSYKTRCVENRRRHQQVAGELQSLD